jgi:hypothetical protein
VPSKTGQNSANHDEAKRIERRQESLPVRETGAVTTSEPLRSSEPLLSSTTPALIMPEASADFRWMVDVGASVTGSLQFARLCSIYLTPCGGGR